MCMTARCLASCCTARKKKSTGIRPMWAKRRPSDRKRRRREIAFCSGPAEDTPSRPGKRSGIRCKTPSGRRGNMSSARFSQSYREADSPARVLAYGSASRWSALGSALDKGKGSFWLAEGAVPGASQKCRIRLCGGGLCEHLSSSEASIGISWQIAWEGRCGFLFWLRRWRCARSRPKRCKTGKPGNPEKLSPSSDLPPPPAETPRK
jgi:hypothetical protein